MDDKRKELVRKQAKEILANFAKAIGSVKLKAEKGQMEVGGFREEGIPTQANESFRKAMFNNAPNQDGECIIAERAKW